MEVTRRARYTLLAVLLTALILPGPLQAQDAPATAPAAPVPATAPATLVSNIFADTDIRQALADVSAQTGVMIIPADDLQGTVSLELKDVPIEKALELMCLPGGFVYGKVGEGVYLVTPADPASGAFRRIAKTEIVGLDYIDSGDLLGALPEFYAKFVNRDNTGPGARTGGGTRVFSSSMGSRDPYGTDTERVSGERLGTRVIVTAPPDLLAEIVTQIKALDTAPEQIMVEALVVETLASNLTDFKADGLGRFLGANSATGLLTYTGVAQDLLAHVQWLVTNHQAETKASPSIVAQEGRTARVEVATEQYFSIVSGPVNYPYTTIQQIAAAISLEITPRLAQRTGEITMKLRPSVADITGQGANDLPIITKRSVETTVRVKDGQVIAIGGLLETVKIVERRKIPILGDIPLIGQLFRSTSKTSRTREVIIFIVPHRLGPDGSPLLQTEAGKALGLVGNSMQSAGTVLAQEPATAPAAAGGRRPRTGSPRATGSALSRGKGEAGAFPRQWTPGPWR